MKPRVTYDKICVVCNKKYQSNRIDSKCCGAACRVQLAEDIKIEKAVLEMKKKGGKIVSQREKRSLITRIKESEKIVVLIRGIEICLKYQPNNNLMKNSLNRYLKQLEALHLELDGDI